MSSISATSASKALHPARAAGLAAGSASAARPGTMLLPDNLYSGSLRVPVTPANRNYLRTLRQLELKAWTATPHPDYAASASERQSLRTAVARVATQARKEFWLHVSLAVVAAAPVLYTLLQSLEFLEKFPAFVRLITQLLA